MVCNDINKCFPQQVVACPKCMESGDGCKGYSTAMETGSTERTEIMYAKQV